jgi:hypothetical protein
LAKNIRPLGLFLLGEILHIFHLNRINYVLRRSDLNIKMKEKTKKDLSPIIISLVIIILGYFVPRLALLIFDIESITSDKLPLFVEYLFKFNYSMAAIGALSAIYFSIKLIFHKYSKSSEKS